MATLAENARTRIREEMDRRKITVQELGQMLGWSKSRVGHLLTGNTVLGVDELAALCFAIGLSPVEAIRDRGLEFMAEMTPTLFRIMERLKQLPAVQAGLMEVLDVKAHTAPSSRHAAPSGPHSPRPKPTRKRASKPQAKRAADDRPKPPPAATDD
jgi:transcriptional regulator with XRE-family HTH domain